MAQGTVAAVGLDPEDAAHAALEVYQAGRERVYIRGAHLCLAA